MSEVPQAKQYWRSLSELENSPEFEAMLHREFPTAAAEYPEGVSRRRWLQLMGASLALGGLAGCRYREEKIVPLSARPVDRVPGKPQRYSTSIELADGVRHLLVTCYDGRPLKVEGNPEHPFSLGGTDAFAQAAMLEMYDPDRGDAVRQRSGRQQITKTWADFDQAARDWNRDWTADQGRGLAVLIEPTESAAVQMMLRRFQAAFPAAALYRHASIPQDNIREGSRLAFGELYRTRPALDQATIVVCLDADPLFEHPAAVRLAREFAERRNAGADDPMSRLYVVESQYTVTGAMADHRLAVRSSDIPAVLGEMEQLVQQGLAGETIPVDASAPKRVQILQAIADDLVSHRGSGLVTVGGRQPAEVHARVHRLNGLLENAGRTVVYTQDTADQGLEFGGLADLVADAQAGRISSLFILGGNPVYDAPADLDVAQALGQVEHTLHLSLRENETSRACQWYLPQTHAFEAWGDARAYDGTISVTQPLIEPLLGGRSTLEILAQLAGQRGGAQALVRQAIEELVGTLSEERWTRLLHDGFMDGTQAAPVQPQLTAQEDEPADPPLGGDELELVFCADPAVYDGRFANNSWLQETPRPLSKLTWDNAALISPATARRLGVGHGTLVTLETGGRTLELPAFVQPGQAENSIGVALGYGRAEAGTVGGSLSRRIPVVGFNANTLRTTSAPLIATGVTLTPSQTGYTFATTQEHHAIDTVGMEERGQRVGNLIREADLAYYQEHPDFARHAAHHPPLESLWREFSYDGHAWGMAIDLNKCIGCNACMVACQAENNIPVVGKDQVARGREMHWIRVDRYFRGDEDDPQTVHQPMTCQQCENAPCESVCPVTATAHSHEGLNDMIYNRCVGTRYCANNCPYKVRRFNFFDNSKFFSAPNRQLVQLAVNPEVTVRSRGVMEKCTFCVQRIQNVKIEAKNERRPIRDGDLMAACQQACPSRAIEFGDLNQPGSRVAAAHQDPRAYAILAELNVKPRNVYLARIRNPHPALASGQMHAHPAGAEPQGHT